MALINGLIATLSSGVFQFPDIIIVECLTNIKVNDSLLIICRADNIPLNHQVSLATIMDIRYKSTVVSVY